MPFHQNPHFVGRDELMDGLRGALAAGKPGVLVQALHGMGGVGKTRLAVEYAYAHAAEYDVVWFLRSDSPTTLLTDYAALGIEVGAVPADTANQTEAAACVRRWLDEHDRWLLIFDDAPELSAVREYLPHRSGGHVIVTSRNPGWRGLGAALKVEVLDKGRASDFLLERSGQTDQASAETLATELDGLPLALEQAAAFIEGSGTPLADYLTMYRARRFELLRPSSGPDDHQSNVAATFGLAVERLLADPDPVVRASVDLLRLSAFLAPQPDSIPLSLLRAGRDHLPVPLVDLVSDDLKLASAIEALRRQALVERTDTGLSVHRLVQAVIQSALDPAERSVWWDRCFEVVAAVAFSHDPDDYKTWPIWALLGPHVDVVVGDANQGCSSSANVGRLVGRYGMYLHDRAQLQAARERHERALAIFEERYGPEHPQAIASLGNLAGVLRDQGDLAGAKQRFEIILRYQERSYGPRDERVARTLGNLGSVHADLGQMTRARALYRRALRILEVSLGPSHQDVGRALVNVGSVQSELGYHEDGRASLVRAIRILEATLSPSDPLIARAVLDLGIILRRQRRPNEALAHEKRALHMLTGAYGSQHPLVAMALSNLGLVHQDLGDLSRARENFERAFAVFEAALGPDHDDTQRALRLLQESGKSEPPASGA